MCNFCSNTIYYTFIQINTLLKEFYELNNSNKQTLGIIIVSVSLSFSYQNECHSIVQTRCEL